MNCLSLFLLNCSSRNGTNPIENCARSSSIHQSRPFLNTFFFFFFPRSTLCPKAMREGYGSPSNLAKSMAWDYCVLGCAWRANGTVYHLTAHNFILFSRRAGTHWFSKQKKKVGRYEGVFIFLRYFSSLFFCVRMEKHFHSISSNENISWGFSFTRACLYMTDVRLDPIGVRFCVL